MQPSAGRTGQGSKSESDPKPMNINKARILKDLDKHAAEFNFPVLNNAYVEFAAARLTAFRSIEAWLIVFEILGFSNREVEFVDDLYAYGSCTEKEGFVGEEIPLTSVPTNPLFDSTTNECIADWSHWSATVDGQIMTFSPIVEEYIEAGVPVKREAGPGSLAEIELLRFLIHRVGENRLFLNDESILKHFPKCGELNKFIQTTQWQHPDVADGEIPSQNRSIRSLVEAITERDPSLFDHGHPNTDWRFWP
jgi:hypothetical protein